MGVCETCGNEYEKTFTVTVGTEAHVYDCFECAVDALAPICDGCGVRILGHGVEVDGAQGGMFCSAHCAKSEGIADAKDHV
jgi:hypothetical protein